MNQKTFKNVEARDVRDVIGKFIDNARYLDQMTVSIDICGKSERGRGTVESYLYNVTIEHLEDCMTY